MSAAAPFLPHGGSGEDFLARYYPHAPRPWLDLSTGINPSPYPVADFSPAAWHALPSPQHYRDCSSAAANHFGVEPRNVAILPGSQIAIALLPRLFSPTTVAVLDPTYGEHAECWQKAGHEVEPVTADRAATSNAAILVLTNPNNPDGVVWTPNEIARVAAERMAAAQWLVVDEAFADVMPEISAAKYCTGSNLIVLRSFGKFFGLAGARLGFAIAPERHARELEDMIGPWAVSGPALELGARAYADRDWQEGTRRRLARAMMPLLDLLTRYGLSHAGGTMLFSLVAHARAPSLFTELCEAGIYVRRFAQNPRWLRFGLPRDDAELRRIECALRLWTEHS
ncbi:MAG TPA: threonine-phosphate decarboxylase CobD [Rhizomicrobium sp.]|nr:threonine-phosphate decarboxylase CobD [Rhizomicrobium sp.]